LTSLEYAAAGVYSRATMAIASLQTTVDRWANAAGTASQRYADGVAATDVDVVGRAVAAQSALLSGFQNAVQSGLWARRLQAVGTAGYKAAVAAKGAANYQTGVAAAKSKFQQKMQAVLQVEAQLQAQIDQMPSGTPAANDARMLAWANGMRNAKAQGAFG
jgi:hypothetical protein